MSQFGGSSMMSSQNPQVKYKKALKQISKLINANKVIRQQAQQQKRQFENQLNQMAMRYNNIQKDYHQMQKENQSLEKYLEQLQERNTQLQRQHLTAEKELAYLNQMLAQQNQELKKVQAIKDQKKVAQLIRTYQEKQQLYLVQRNSHEQLIKKLREEQNRLQFQVSQERAMRQQTQDKFDLMRAQINQYRQLNKVLIQRNQKAYQQMYSKQGNTREKQKQIQGLVQQFRKQISSLKTAKESATQRIGAQYQTNYQMILEQKNKILSDYVQMKELYQTAQNKIRDMYDVQERMKAAISKNQALNQQCNMLKSKIIVMESRQAMDDGGTDYQFNNKQFDDKVTNLLSQGDPLIAIKNSDQTSHFKILKSYIFQLRQKLQKVHTQRKQYTKKYKSISSKFTKVVQQSNRYEQQNKILRGKVQGFQKLTQKLQNQLEKNIMLYQSQVSKISHTANDLLIRKSGQLQKSMKFMKEQIMLIQERSNKIQKNLRQEVQSQKLQISTLTINKQQMQEKLKQSNEFLTIYKKKLNQLSQMHQQLQEKNSQLNENLIKVSQLYKDQKSRTQTLSNQKTQISTKLSSVNQQIDKKVADYQQQLRKKQESFGLQIKKYQADNQRLQFDVQNLRKQVLINKRDFQERKERDLNQVQQLRRELQYHQDIQNRYNYQKKKNRDLQTQNQTLKIKNTKYVSQRQKANSLEDQLMRKNDQTNDLKRKIINIQSALTVSQNDLKQQKNQVQSLRKQNAKIKMKLLQNGQQVRKQIDGKDQQSRKVISKLNQEISDLNLQLADEKSRNSRLNSQTQRYKSEKQRFQEFCEELKDKDLRSSQTVNNLKGRVQSAIQQLQKSKSQNRMLQLSVKRLNDQIDNLQSSINNLKQENVAIRVKQQQSQSSKSEILRAIELMKFSIQDVEQFAVRLKSQGNLSWQDNKARDSMSQIVLKLKKIIQEGGASFNYSHKGSRINSSSQYNYGGIGGNGINTNLEGSGVNTNVNLGNLGNFESIGSGHVSSHAVYSNQQHQQQNQFQGTSGTYNISSQPVYQVSSSNYQASTSNYKYENQQSSPFNPLTKLFGYLKPQQSQYKEQRNQNYQNNQQEGEYNAATDQMNLNLNLKNTNTGNQNLIKSNSSRKSYTSDSMMFGQNSGNANYGGYGNTTVSYSNTTNISALGSGAVRYHEVTSAGDYTPKNFFKTYADSEQMK